MKKLFLMALLCVAAISASAQQNITVWYGANVSNVSVDGDGPDTGFKPLNVGVSYTGALADAFDWSAGLGYVTKATASGAMLTTLTGTPASYSLRATPLGNLSIRTWLRLASSQAPM